MEPLAAIFAAGLLAAAPTHAAPDPTVHYRLKPLMSDGHLTGVQFEMRFRAPQALTPEALTEIDLPDSWVRGKDYYKALKDIEITGATAVTTPQDQPAHRLITAAPGAEITVRYRIDANLKTGEEAPKTDMNYPVIGPDRFYILGETVWPTVASQGARHATFSADMPPGWRFASNLQTLKSLHGTDSDVIESILMGGTDVHIDTVQTPNTRLRIASAGHFDFPLTAFSDRVQRIVATEQAFWGDGQPDFLVTLAPITPAPGYVSVHGEGRPGAFAVIAVPDTPLETMSFTLAHEYFHSWNPGRLGQMDQGPNEALGYWFSEGFTDYYGRKLALKAGVVSLAQFIAEWNQTLARYAKSPHKTAPNTELRDHQWDNETWHKTAYDRGAILAIYLNAQWRQKGVPLDRFMHSLRDTVAADPAFASLPLEQRLDTVATGLGVPLHDDMKRFIDDGAPLALPQDAFGGCLTVVTEPVADVELGFDLERTIAARSLVGGTPDGPAYRSGLRDGMTWHSVTADPTDSAVAVTVKTHDDQGHEQIFTYLPVAKTTHPRQKLVAPDGLTPDRAKACAAALTG
ncbi:hypothetical protein AEAC466_19985 [Asticcacaulis sp. AC466]|uniref:M61 family metallopeptidase n=1 Tax=Asticcacaulis sp. AC466 TaxID=1282362 RepID=UPI0003C3F9A2|nr:hypothetical protein [Asticcacaulis sp. AC466]ESQ81845.1 hypothetical protein AEAC466_19985 [Asticcacaulis sp. AC466]